MTPEQIVDEHLDEMMSPREYAATRRALIAALIAYGDEQLERAAQIAEQSHPQPCICTTCLIHAEAAAAIRRALKSSKEKENNSVK